MTTRESSDLESGSTEIPAEYAALTATVRELVKVMREGGIDQLEIASGDLKIALSARERVTSPGPNGVQPAPRPAPPVASQVAVEPGLDGVRVISSPMIGTFYAAPAPGERPFVQVGDMIDVGQTVAIIEAMKIMNEIVAEWAGIVEEIVVRDGEAVEYGHPLLRVRVQA